MDEIEFDAVYEAFRADDIQSSTELEEYLALLGFMIVPIEDPTNLRFGVED